MKIFLNSRLILVTIIILAAVLRFYSLGDIPGSLNWDEVSWGYNSYSILETGKDEHGKFMPLSFEAFGDFKQPGYVYMSTIPIYLFELNPFSVRFISALAGTLSVFMIYLLVLELFRSEKRRKLIGLFGALLFAISPWSIVFSRVAYEANVALLFVLLGVYLFLYAVRTNNIIILMLSIIPLTMSSFTYHSLKIFIPLYTFVLAAYAYKNSSFKKSIILAFLILYVLLNLVWVVDMRSTSRGRSVLLFSQSDQILKNSLEQMSFDVEQNSKVFKYVHNRRIVYGSQFFENYLKHFDLSYLLIRGDNARHHAPGIGLVYLVNLFFIFIGIYFAIKKHRKSLFLILSWILLAPIASSLAIEAPNASRNLIMLPGLIMLASYGWFISFIKVFVGRLRILFYLFVLLLIANFIYFSHQYFEHVNSSTLEYWQDGYKEAVIEANNVSKINNVFITDSIEQGYMFYLFHNNINPENYLSMGGSAIRDNSCFNINRVYFGDCINSFKDGDFYISDKEDLLNISNNIKYFSLENQKEIEDSKIYLYKISD